MSKIYPGDFEIKTEFTKIRELIKRHCLSNSGKEKVDELNFQTELETIEYQLDLTSEFKHIIQFKDNFPNERIPMIVEGRYSNHVELICLTISDITV